MDKIKDYFKNNTNSYLFLISSGEHLNTYNEGKYIINDKAFNKINSIVKKTCG